MLTLIKPRGPASLLAQRGQVPALSLPLTSVGHGNVSPPTHAPEGWLPAGCELKGRRSHSQSVTAWERSVHRVPSALARVCPGGEATFIGAAVGWFLG